MIRLIGEEPWNIHKSNQIHRRRKKFFSRNRRWPTVPCIVEMSRTAKKRVLDLGHHQCPLREEFHLSAGRWALS